MEAGGDPGCEGAGERWIAIAETYCARCHGPGSPGSGGLSSVLDVNALIDSGRVTPGDPEGSPIYTRIASGAMPPAAAGASPTPDEVDEVRHWIACGAPAWTRPDCERDCTTFVSIESRISAFTDDVLSFDLPADRQDVRYIDLSNFANAGHGAPRIQQWRDAVFYVLNSLSRNPEVVVPEAIDPQQLMFRIRLSDYGWTPATWQRVTADYPYMVSYNPDSRSFPIDDGRAQLLRDETNTDVPYVQADWFFSHVSRPPLYYDVLELPSNLAQVEELLGIDIAQNIAEARVIRAGFTESGPSPYNRVIERHDLGQQGALWTTYDFAAGAGTSNLLTHPLDFEETSRQVLFSLPNGMHAYFITDALGQRLDKAPSNAVRDPGSDDFTIEAGISCVSCHASSGVLVRFDELRDQIVAIGAPPDQLDGVLDLYRPDNELQVVFDQDQAHYEAALNRLGAATFIDGRAHELDRLHRGLMSFEDVASVLGVETSALAAAVDAGRLTLPSELVALRSLEVRLARERFDAICGELVTALGLGTPISPAR